RDAGADLDDAADLLQVDLRLVARELPLDDLADLSGLNHRSPLRVAQATLALERGLTTCEALSQTCQLPIEAAIDEEASDFGDKPTEERAVHRLFEHHLLATEHPAQPARQRRALAVAERQGRAHARAHAAGGVVHELAERGGHARHALGAPVRGDERQEVARERPDLEPRGHL